MQTLGERLQEARQRLGVTLREAAEFTKIRTDYLQSMEANQFESIPLADVYKRGFVKVYAKYLRLDDEKAGADFNTHHSAKAARRPLDAAGEERGCIIERPLKLRVWVSENKPKLSDDDFQKAKMTWYREDRGRETVQEMVSLLEAAGKGPTTC